MLSVTYIFEKRIGERWSGCHKNNNVTPNHTKKESIFCRCYFKHLLIACLYLFFYLFFYYYLFYAPSSVNVDLQNHSVNPVGVLSSSIDPETLPSNPVFIVNITEVCLSDTVHHTPQLCFQLYGNVSLSVSLCVGG